MRLRDPLGDRVRLRVRLRVALRDRLRDRLRVALALLRDGGGAYAHCSPDVTSSPFMPPSCTKYTSWVVAVTLAVDASSLPPQPAAALSLPTTHPNGRSHDGQPVPTYSTVLLALWPHVLTVSVPPSGAVGPRNSEYSSREPGKKARSPAAHVPAVYMPGVPSTSADSGGAEPDAPASGRTLRIPRQMGDVGVGVGVGDRVPGGVRLGVGDGVAEPVLDALPVPVCVSLALGLPVWLDVPVGELVRVAVPERVGLDEPVSELVRVTVPVRVGLGVPEVELVRVTVPVRVGLGVPVGEGVLVVAKRQGRMTPLAETSTGTIVSPLSPRPQQASLPVRLRAQL